VKKKIKRTTKKKNKTGNHDQALRDQLVSLLKGGQAHVHFMDALDGFPEAKRGTFVEGLPHTGWQLMEHVRIVQWDILEFSRSAKHVSPGFPEGYWPKTPVPPDKAAWEKSVQSFQHDLQEMIKLVKNSNTERDRRFCAKRCCWPITTRITWGSWWTCGARWAPGRNRKRSQAAGEVKSPDARLSRVSSFLAASRPKK
jgi:hypothetical protein